MAWVVLAAIIAVPIAEFAVFAKAAQWIGLVPTILLALAAVFVGLALVRMQGLRTMMRVRNLTEGGRMPGRDVFDGICISLAGGLFILPGFLSDLLALLLLIPAFRSALLAWSAARMKVVAAQSSTQRGPAAGPTVIEGEYTVLDNDEPR